VSVTPAAEHLFQVNDNDDAMKLDKRKAKTNHTFVTKCLILTKRAHPDIHTAVEFLTIRVMYPDKDNWKNLVHLVRYLRGRAEMSLTLRADDVAVVKWWVDRSHAVYSCC
jgi:hypothetical protein